MMLTFEPRNNVAVALVECYPTLQISVWMLNAHHVHYTPGMLVSIPLTL